MKVISSLVLLLVTSSVWAQEKPNNVVDEPALRGAALEWVEGRSDYTIGTDDLLDVNVFEIQELSTSGARVSPSGQIIMPLLGPVAAAGFTPIGLASVIEERLKQRYVKNPHVIVSIREYGSQPITVIGQVRSPSIYQIKGQKNLRDILALAGGVAASSKTILILRNSPPGSSIATAEDFERASNSAGGIIKIDADQLFEGSNSALNIPVYPNDVINALAAPEPIYLLGDFVKPGSYPVPNGRSLKLTQVIALSGGFTSAAKRQDCRIIRYHQDGTKDEIAIDAKKVLEGKAEDVDLKPNDILYAPTNTSKGKAILNRGIESSIGVLTGRLIWRL